MMAAAESQTIRIPLDTAGTQVIDRAFEYLHVLRFENTAGVPVLDGEVLVSLSVSEDDFMPLLYNNKVIGKTDRGRVRWVAQAGKVAVITIAADARAFAIDTPNPKQLVVASGGATLTAAAVSVGVAATLVAAASTTRMAVTIQNLGTVDVFVGPSGVTVASGVKIASGGAITLDKQTAAVYAISGSAAQDVRVLTEST